MEFLDSLEQPDTLDWIIIITGLFLIITCILILITLSIQLARTRRNELKQDINDELENWLAEVLLAEGDEIPEMSRKLSVYFRRRSNYSYIIKKLIHVRKNLSGASQGRIIQIYEDTGLKQNSLARFYSDSWHRKMEGIYHLYMMNQLDMEQEISSYSNHPHEFVRTEAQLALITFRGFRGLGFLSDLTHDLNEWQQLRLSEQLNAFTVENISGLEQWLTSRNSYVVLFALKLAANFQQLHVHEQVLETLNHESEKVRAEAIHTLSRIADHSTAGILIRHYPFETSLNKKNILLALQFLAGDEEESFLQAQLESQDEDLKLLAAGVLFNTIPTGESFLKGKALDDPDRYGKIYLHVKREASY